MTEAGEHRFFAGWRSDPFFFDTQGILNDLQFTGTDFFADKNVCSIVLELPNSDPGTRRVGVWARTLIAEPGGWIQVDRGALPAQAVFLVGEERDAYLAGGNRPTMLVSFRSLRTRSSTRVGIRKKKQGRWRALCCRR